MDAKSLIWIPEIQRIFVLIYYEKMHGFHGNRSRDSEVWECTYKTDHISTNTWSHLKAKTTPFNPMASNENYLICIFVNFYENIKDGRKNAKTP